MNSIIKWNKPKLERFKAEYEKTKAEGRDAFAFEGNDFAASYAKYLIEYLEGSFK